MEKYNLAYFITWDEMDKLFRNWGKQFQREFEIAEKDYSVKFSAERTEDDWNLHVEAVGSHIDESFVDMLKKIDEQYRGEDEDGFDPEMDLSITSYSKSTEFSKETSEHILAEILEANISTSDAFYEGIIVLCDKQED